MEVITIESRAYKELLEKIDAIARMVVMSQPETQQNPDETWVDGCEVCTYLKISERTLQRMRTEGIISYSIISGKSYYTIGELKRLLNERKIRSNEESIQELIDHHRITSQLKDKSNGKRRNSKNTDQIA